MDFEKYILPTIHAVRAKPRPTLEQPIDYRFIALTLGKVAEVDICDYDWLNQWSWYANKGRWGFYAIRQVWDGTRQRQLTMASFILGLPRGALVDHMDQDKLNNRRYNLRPATQTQNVHNVGIRSTNTSGYIGVSFQKERNHYQANISHNNKQFNIGKYKTALEAAIAYDVECVRLRGEFARTNFPVGNYLVGGAGIEPAAPWV